ncbi:MAG TPA: HD domain-containing phosphohydrolase [Actinomycetota bacterium]|nr:HD domain-containing phosphohydrolase [Actinomycetota bacterium]
MADKEPPTREPVRAAELIAAACLATDLGMGFPFEHGLHGTLMAITLADRLGVDRETESQTYFASLLMYSGCTTDEDIAARIFAGPRNENITPVQFGSTTEALRGFLRALPPPNDLPHRRAYEVARRLVPAARFRRPHFAALCEVAEMMAERLGLPPEMYGLFLHLTERWDGKGVLRRAKGDEIPLPVRIVHVARDAAYQRLVGGDDHAVEVIRRRAGHAFDPGIASRFVEEAPEIMAAARTTGSAWEAVLAVEPRPWRTLDGEGVDRALAAIGDFADLASPHLSGHSRGVGQLAAAAARLSGFGPSDVALVQRAGFVHDVGRVAIEPRTWQKPEALTVDEWEQVRLHPYHTERVLLRSGFLASLADVACAHHERLDGSGYHRRASATSLTPAARLLAAADAFHAMSESRPHRGRRSPEEAAEQLSDEARGGRQDPEMAAAVIEAAGQPAPPVERPAGLTEREAEVVGLVARGLQTKQVARRLGISIKTADRHIQNAYRKIGVSTRAAATLFAMEHGLVAGRAFADPRAAARSRR